MAEKRKLKEVATDFIERVGTDGFYDFAVRKRPGSITWPCRVMWGILLIVAWSIVVYQVTLYITKYVGYPVNTNVELKFDSTAYFPAVTICNLNPIKQEHMSDLESGNSYLQDKLSQAPPSNSTFMQKSGWDQTYADKQGRDNFKAVGDSGQMWSPDEMPEEMKVKAEYYNAVFKMDDSKVDSAGHQINEMLIECTFQQQQCYPNNFTRIRHPTYGLCYTFNAGFERTNGAVVNNSIQRTNLPGPVDGLSVQLYAESDAYVPIIASSVGFRVILHSQAAAPHPEDSGYTIAAGFATALELRKVEVSRLPMPYNGIDCQPPWSPNMNQIRAIWPRYNYTMEMCMKLCYQRELAALCGCVDSQIYYLESRASATACPVDGDKAFCKRDFDVGFRSGTKGSVCQTECPQACMETDFETQISSAQWPNQYYLEIMKGSLDSRSTKIGNLSPQEEDNEIRSNMVKLDVYYQTLNYKMISEEAGYVFIDMLADLGGAADLWVGMSILCACQCVEFFFELIAFLCCGGSRNTSDVAPSTPATTMSIADDEKPHNYPPPDDDFDSPRDNEYDGRRPPPPPPPMLRGLPGARGPPPNGEPQFDDVSTAPADNDSTNGNIYDFSPSSNAWEPPPVVRD